MRARPRIRTRLGLWCAALVVASGAAMLVVSLSLVEHAVDAHLPEPTNANLSDDPGLRRVQELALVASQRAVVRETVSQVRTTALAGLLGLAVLSLLAGWVVAGRMLRPASALLAAEFLTANPAVATVDLRTDLERADVVGDPVLVGQLLENLVINAVRYNRLGGLLDVRVERVDDDVVLAVVNDGRILAAEEAPLLVDRFRRGDDIGDSTPGFGRGLSIVAAHDAALEVSARPEGGLQVRVLLPAAQRDPVRA